MWIQLEPGEVETRGMDYVRERIAHYTKIDNREAANYRAAVVTREGDLEMDEGAVVSVDDDGAYVQCWKWVSSEDAGLEARGQSLADT